MGASVVIGAVAVPRAAVVLDEEVQGRFILILLGARRMPALQPYWAS
jgi:hypothetical protein